MSYIVASDPLALLAIAAGQVTTPGQQVGSPVGENLDTQQRALKVGDPVPIVFARRVGSSGGILISPGATEARFENSLTNEVTASYLLVLSEGQMDPIPVKDVFQRSCRVGTFSQTYSRRAGTWQPGNFIVARAGYDVPVCPYFCGTVGGYPDMTTLSFVSGAIPDGFDFWNRQVHCFIRGGMWVPRLQDSVMGPSNSFPDLTLWLMRRSARLPDEVIDLTAMAAADLFTRTNGLTCNCWIQDSRNLPDFLADWAPYFLLASSSSGGKRGLRPVLPVSNGAIITTAITPDYAFGESTVIPGSVEIQYIDRSERLPFVAQMTWRQQTEDDYGIIRTAEVRFSGTAESGPYESHDLSEFCTSEAHAVKVGAYLVAKRVYTSHTIRFAVKPGPHSTLEPGAIIRVRLKRDADGYVAGVHDYLYQLERVTKTLAGDLGYEATHFPIDAQGRSLVARAVASAQGTGIIMSSNRTGVTCDVNSPVDNTIPPETWTDVDFGTIDNPFGEPITFDPDYGVIDIGGEFNSPISGLSGTGGLDGIGGGGDLGGTYGGSGISGVPGDLMPEGPWDGGAGSGGGNSVPVGGSIPGQTPPNDGCTYTYKAVRVCGGGEPPNPFYTQVGGYNGYIIDPSDAGCSIRIYTIKECPGGEPVTTVEEYVVQDCTPDPGIAGTWSPTGATTVTGTVVFGSVGVINLGGGLYQCNPEPDTYIPVNFTIPGGVTGYKVVYSNYLGQCGNGHASATVIFMKGCEELAGAISRSGGRSTGVTVGLTFSSTAPDAVSADSYCKSANPCHADTYANPNWANEIP